MEIRVAATCGRVLLEETRTARSLGVATTTTNTTTTSTSACDTRAWSVVVQERTAAAQAPRFFNTQRPIKLNLDFHHFFSSSSPLFLVFYSYSLASWLLLLLLLRISKDSKLFLSSWRLLVVSGHAGTIISRGQ